MFVLRLRWSGAHVASLGTQSSAACCYGEIAVGKDVLVPGPHEALRDAFPCQQKVDKGLF